MSGYPLYICTHWFVGVGVFANTLYNTFRRGNEVPRLLDENEKDARIEERRKLFKEYRANRHTVIELRNLDREQRNEAKIKQLELAEKWQVKSYYRHLCNSVLNNLATIIL